MGSFARLGYEGISLRALGVAAGVDMALAARLFGSKAALWNAVVDRLAERRPARLTAEDPASTFSQFIRFFAGLSFEMPAFPAFPLQEAANPGERLDILVLRLVRPFRERCRPIIEVARGAGDSRQGAGHRLRAAHRGNLTADGLARLVYRA